MLDDELPPDFDVTKALLPDAIAAFEAVTLRPPRPDILHHYTTADGVLGIIRTERLWATSARYMNDASEISYGRDLVCSVIREECSGQLGLVKEWLSGFEGVVERTHDRHETYITCFCEADDLLSQWRAYGAGRGFALAFYAPPLSRIEGSTIFRVEYHRPTQEAAVRETLRIHIAEFMAALAKRDKDRIPYLSAGLALLLSLWVVAFKHPSFSEEREWRLTPLVIEKQLVRSDRGWLRPYVEVSLREQQTQRMPLHHITHGPSPHPELEKRALQLLIQDTAYGDVPITGSVVPLRV